jgi:hypothetical protein
LGDIVTDGIHCVQSHFRADDRIALQENCNMVTRNEGNVDRALRIIAGLALVSLVFVGPQTPLGWIGLVPLATGLIGWCPAYRLFGINTCPRR